MLLHLRVSKHLMDCNRFVFNDVANFRQYLKVLVPFMIYNSGGHSFHEFMFPLSLEKMRENFSCMAGYADIDTKTLFMDGNQHALRAALMDTMRYHLWCCDWIDALDKELSTLMMKMRQGCCYNRAQIRALEQIQTILLSAKPDNREEQTYFIVLFYPYAA